MSDGRKYLNLLQKILRLMWAFAQWRTIGVEARDLSGKTILVTGAARGIGAEVTRLLAGWGAHVLLTCRNAEQGENLRAEILSEHPGAEITVLGQADTSDLESMADLARRVIAQLNGKALDGLILNAGIAGKRCLPSKQGYESHVATNVLGHHLLVLSLLDELAKSDCARVVYVTGDIYVLAADCTLDYQYRNLLANYAYARSKLGVSWNVLSMQEHVEAQGNQTQCVSVHPGVVASELVQGGDFLKRLFLVSPQKSAQSVVFAMVDEAVRGGDYIHNVRGKMTLPANDPVLNRERRREFWEECCGACRPYLPKQ